MAVMPAQLPDLISAAGQSQDPPTQSTLGSASQDAALASPMPPVGQNFAFGNGPASARSALIPPDCSAGKNLTRSKPAASAAISSEAVAMPGANGRSLAAAAFSSSGVAPGLMPNTAPSALARARSSPLRMVPIPTTASGTSAMIALAASTATGGAQRDFQHPHPAGHQRACQRHGMFEPLDGQHRNDDRLSKQRGELFPSWYRSHFVAPAGMAERGMMAPG